MGLRSSVAGLACLVAVALAVVCEGVLQRIRIACASSEVAPLTPWQRKQRPRGFGAKSRAWLLATSSELVPVELEEEK